MVKCSVCSRINHKHSFLLTWGVLGNMSTPMDVGMDVKPGDYVGGTNFGEEGLAVNFTPRRERFTFRKKHLEVLEMCFKTNQYPTYEERTDIAQRCNDIMEVVCKCLAQLFFH